MHTFRKLQELHTCKLEAKIRKPEGQIFQQNTMFDVHLGIASKSGLINYMPWHSHPPLIIAYNAYTELHMLYKK